MLRESFFGEQYFCKELSLKALPVFKYFNSGRWLTYLLTNLCIPPHRVNLAGGVLPLFVRFLRQYCILGGIGVNTQQVLFFPPAPFLCGF